MMVRHWLLRVALVALLAHPLAARCAPPTQYTSRAIVPKDLPAPETDSRASPTRQAYRLLLETEDVATGGFRVKKVLPNSPTARMTRLDQRTVTGMLEPDDVITHINGVKVTRAIDGRQMIDLSGGRPLVLTAVDKRTGKAFDWVVKPARVEIPNAGNTPPAGDPKNPPKVHAVLVGDTRDRDIGKGVQADIDRWTHLLKGGTMIHPSRVGTVYTLTDREATPDRVLAAIAALNPAPDDTVLVYGSSHGGNDAQFGPSDRLSEGHFLALHLNNGKGDLMHQTLREHVYAKPGRLKIVITDTCNNKATATPRVNAPLNNAIVGDALPKVKYVSTVEELLFYHRGQLDLNSAKKGQVAMGLDTGGVYTTALCDALARYNDWERVLKSAADATTEQYPNQHPRAFDKTLRRDDTRKLEPLLTR